jgi:hypothetical protein
VFLSQSKGWCFIIIQNNGQILWRWWDLPLDELEPGSIEWPWDRGCPVMSLFISRSKLINYKKHIGWSCYCTRRAATSNRALWNSLSAATGEWQKEPTPHTLRPHQNGFSGKQGSCIAQRDRHREQAIPSLRLISSPFLCHFISFVIPFIFQG